MQRLDELLNVRYPSVTGVGPQSVEVGYLHRLSGTKIILRLVVFMDHLFLRDYPVQDQISSSSLSSSSLDFRCLLMYGPKVVSVSRGYTC